MKKRAEVFIALIIFVFGCQTSMANRSAAENIAGMYFLSEDNASATMEVRAKEDYYVVLLSGGGSEAAGAATAADCTIRAIGKLEGNTLLATFTAIETDTFSYTNSEAEKENRKVKVVFRSNYADVVHVDTFAYCGLGVHFTGSYRRKTAGSEGNQSD
jgi:ABC-type Na+ efflux pump permease subunit